MTFNFIALDFETANEKRGSVIQVGLSKFRDSELVATHAVFVTPPPGMRYFLPRNTAVHGIRPEQIQGAPEWPNLLERIDRVRGNYPIVAHNASFERTVIERASEAYGITPPSWRYLCTLKLAKLSFPNESSHSLGILSGRLGLPTFAHHDAGADAEASARLLLEIARRRGADAIESFPAREWELPARKIKRTD
mgnify:CR=1 FL=1|tara:strand:- start:72745 stop:73326 length:582 start_codon:yes stop_codon:yes gene_type:complete